MVDFSKLGISDDTIREYKDKYGDDAERMLMQHFGGGRSEQEERTGQQDQDMDMTDRDRNAAM